MVGARDIEKELKSTQITNRIHHRDKGKQNYPHGFGMSVCTVAYSRWT